MVDGEILGRKAASVRKLVADLDAKSGVSADTFHTLPDTQYYVLFALEKAAQDCLDLAAHVVSDQGWDVAEAYKELFPVLERHGVIDADMSMFMQELAGFRNVLVHRYGFLSYDRAYRFYVERGRLVDFCVTVLRHFNIIE